MEDIEIDTAKGQVVYMDEAELALRFIEEVLGTTRPEGVRPRMVLDQMIADFQHPSLQRMVSDLVRCSSVALTYFAEVLNEGRNNPLMTKLDKRRAN